MATGKVHLTEKGSHVCVWGVTFTVYISLIQVTSLAFDVITAVSAWCGSWLASYGRTSVSCVLESKYLWRTEDYKVPSSSSSLRNCVKFIFVSVLESVAHSTIVTASS